MSIGFAALLDHIAAIAKVATASLDDVATQAARASVKAVGVVIDDTAVTPSYAMGLPPNRELPVVARIAAGSLRNKLVFLLPIALVLGLLAPWAITPLLMLGGAYLCYEGAEKVLHALGYGHTEADDQAAGDGGQTEAARIRSAVQTDFILSAEIMTITLGDLPEASVWVRGLILGLVGVLLTGFVYGVVALLVKADNLGSSLAGNARPLSDPLGRGGAQGLWRADRVLAPLTTALGRGLVAGMPHLLGVLGVVGTAAMIWVGGGIILHGLDGYGLDGLEQVVDLAALLSRLGIGTASGLAGAVTWLLGAAGSGLFGLLVGAVLVLLVDRAATPIVSAIRNRMRPRPRS